MWDYKNPAQKKPVVVYKSQRTQRLVKFHPLGKEVIITGEVAEKGFSLTELPEAIPDDIKHILCKAAWPVQTQRKFRGVQSTSAGPSSSQRHSAVGPTASAAGQGWSAASAQQGSSSSGPHSDVPVTINPVAQLEQIIRIASACLQRRFHAPSPGSGATSVSPVSGSSAHNMQQPQSCAATASLLWGQSAQESFNDVSAELDDSVRQFLLSQQLQDMMLGRGSPAGGPSAATAAGAGDAAPAVSSDAAGPSGEADVVMQDYAAHLQCNQQQDGEQAPASMYQAADISHGTVSAAASLQAGYDAADASVPPLHPVSAAPGFQPFWGYDVDGSDCFMHHDSSFSAIGAGAATEARRQHDLLRRQGARHRSAGYNSDMPCLATLKFWRYSPAAMQAPLQRLVHTIKYVVLCSEMSVGFSPCGRYLAAFVACQPANMADDDPRVTSDNIAQVRSSQLVASMLINLYGDGTNHHCNT